MLGCLDPRSTETVNAVAAVRRARRIVEDAGGFDAQLAEIAEAVSAHHANNYMPLVAKHRRRDRATMFAFTSELRTGDIAVRGSQAYANWSAQRLPWEQSEGLLEEFCAETGLPGSARAFTDQLVPG